MLSGEGPLAVRQPADLSNARRLSQSRLGHMSLVHQQAQFHISSGGRYMSSSVLISHDPLDQALDQIGQRMRRILPELGQKGIKHGKGTVILSLRVDWSDGVVSEKMNLPLSVGQFGKTLRASFHYNSILTRSSLFWCI